MQGENHWTSTERRAREAFDDSVDALDAHTRSQLNRARQAAVAASGSRRRLAWTPWWPVAAAASIVLVTTMLLWRAPDGGSGGAMQASGEGEEIEAVELLAAGDDLDLAADDPAFYAWLDADDLTTGNGTG